METRKTTSMFQRLPGQWPAVAVALLVFGLGAMVYLWDRAAGTTLLLPLAFGHRAGDEMVFGMLGGALPSFSHAFAFSLLTAVLLGHNRRARWLGCGGWWLVDALFELGQHVALKERLATLLPGVIGNYLARGTFDVFDLLATTLGVIAAAGFHFRFFQEQTP